MLTTEKLHQISEARGIPLRTLDDVRADLARAKKTGADVAFARLMVAHGRLTDEAREFARRYQG